MFIWVLNRPAQFLPMTDSVISPTTGLNPEILEHFRGFPNTYTDKPLHKDNVREFIQGAFSDLTEQQTEALVSALEARADSEGIIDLRQLAKDIYPQAAPEAIPEVTANSNGPHVTERSLGAGNEQGDMGDDQAAYYEVIMRSLGSDEVDMLRDAFIHMDMDSDGFVSLEEMMHVVRTVVGDEKFAPLAEYLQPIFIVADKDRDGKLNLTEFLLSFAEGPGVVPTEVINACVSSIRVRLTDEEIYALQERFRKIDTNGDGYIDPQELLVGLREALSSKFPEPNETTYAQILNVVMALADTDHDGRLSLSEFIRSFQEDQGVLPAVFIDTRAQNVARRFTAEEIQVLRKAFGALDRNNDGFVDYNEMYKTLWDALSNNVEDKEQVRELCDLIMATADRNKDGKLSLSEFVKNFDGNSELMQVPLAAASERIEKIKQRLASILDSSDLEKLSAAFRHIDINSDGFIDGQELSTSLLDLLQQSFPDKSAESLNYISQLILSTADIDKDNKLSLKEFILSFATGEEGGVIPVPLVHQLAKEPKQNTNDQQPHIDEQQNQQSVQHNQSPVSEQPKEALVVVTSPSRSTTSAKPESNGYEGSPVRSDASGCPITDAQLRREFDKFDVSGNGYLDREEFKKIYLSFEHYGIDPTPNEINEVFSRYSRGKNTISYEEFCILMLQRSRM